MQEMRAWGRMSSSLTVNPGTITVNPITYAKPTNTAVVNAASATFSGVVAGISINSLTLAQIDALLPGTLSIPTYAATFTSTDAGTNIPVTVTISNLTYTSPTGVATPVTVGAYSTTADIIAASLTLSTAGMSIQTKSYNGSTTAVVIGTPTIASGTIYTGDSVAPTISGANSTSPDVGTQNVTVTMALTNSNYAATNPTVVLPGVITAATTSVIGVSAKSKVVDGTTALAIDGTASISPKYGSDNPSISISAAFPSSSIGCYTITGSASLSGLGASNYTVSPVALGTACITAPESPKAPIPDRYAEHGNSNIIDDYKANAFVASVQQAPPAGAPPRKPMTQGDYIAGLKAVNAARFIR